MMPNLDDLYWTYQNLIYQVGINGLLALSMYVVLAVGQLSLGQAAFAGLGAYSGALITMKLGLPFYLALPASCIAPVLFALAIGLPTIRLSGVYLAIATIGLGEVLRAIYLNTDAMTGQDFFGGALGLSSIPIKTTATQIYALLAAAIVILWLVGRSRIGRAMEAMRQDEPAAQVMGVPLRRYKMGALVASAILAGLAGSLDAHSNSFIGPNSYGFEPAIAILSYALLGGIGTPIAPVLGAAILTILPELLRGVANLRGILSGVIIVAAVLFLPGGILPLRLRRRAA
jgi:branched-chain amino acid transport system permease protein